MNKIVVPTGYMGSGSSAITDLLSEFKGYKSPNGSFEYVFMHCPNGVFDLEDKLLIGNNALRSDEALYSFEKTMEELYNRKLWWVANYKKNVGKEFIEITKEYIESLVMYRPNYYWYMQEKLNFTRFIVMCIRKIVLILTNNKVMIKRPLEYSPMRVSIPNSEEFYKKTKDYIYKVFNLLGLKESNIVLDQLLLPFNMYRAKNYFDDNFVGFIVERDPRDVFISNKYIWDKMCIQVPYPTDAEEYCDYYLKIRKMEREVDNENIYRIKFEDLIYNYENTVNEIMNILNLNKEDHIYQKKYFIPEKSINNTQLFLNEKYGAEVKILENKLEKYLYEFPYKNECNIEKVF